MALGKYIEVDGVRYPNPINTSESFINTETINTSESGKELDSVQRLGQLVVTMNFQVSSRWLAHIKADCKKPHVIFKYCGIEYEGRLRASSNALAQYSENADNTAGYWTITATFTER